MKKVLAWIIMGTLAFGALGLLTSVAYALFITFNRMTFKEAGIVLGMVFGIVAAVVAVTFLFMWAMNVLGKLNG